MCLHSKGRKQLAQASIGKQVERFIACKEEKSYPQHVVALWAEEFHAL